MKEFRYSRTDTATANMPWRPGEQERRARERSAIEPITRGEFCAFRKDSYDFRESVTDWMGKLDRRMDVQDGQLSGINEIRKHVEMTCKLAQLAYKSALALLAIAVPAIAVAKALGLL